MFVELIEKMNVFINIKKVILNSETYAYNNSTYSIETIYLYTVILCNAYCIPYYCVTLHFYNKNHAINKFNENKNFADLSIAQYFCV